MHLEFALIKFITTCFNLSSHPFRTRWNFTFFLTWVVTEKSIFAAPASLKSDVAVMYRDNRKSTSQKRISSTSHLSVCTISHQRKKRNRDLQSGRGGQQYKLFQRTKKGLFALLNWLFKLKWYKDGSTDVHAKSFDLSLLHQLLSKTITVFKHRKANVISMKASEQQSSFHWIVQPNSCLIFRARKKITERQGRLEKEINWKTVKTYYGGLPYLIQKTESTRDSMLPKSFANT